MQRTAGRNTQHVMRRLARSIAPACSVLAAGLLSIVPVTSAGAATPARAVAFPQPGAQTALPTTSISIRGVAIGDIGEFSATGSRSGVHPGTWTAHPDNNGASF